MKKHIKNQLFLLHFAGGNSYSFEFLKKEIKDINAISLELPGRGRRHREELIKDKEQAIIDYYNQIKSLRNGMPYIIYGHSMGATIGLSVTAKLEAIGDKPNLLIVSGSAGPGVKEDKGFLYYQLDDLKFKDELIKLGGISKEIIDNQELIDFFLPIIRADFECLETSFFSEKGLKINTPLFALMGSEEETCNQITNWKKFTKKKLDYKLLDGNHFFIYEYATELANIFKSAF